MLAIMKFSLGWLLLSAMFGGPVMVATRMLSQEDEDYVKGYLEALREPHVRQPE